MIERLSVRLSRRLAVCFAAMIAVQAAGAEPGAEVQAGYSLDPLSEATFSPAEVALETSVLNNWLNSNYDRLSIEEQRGPREYLYYLINARIKHLYADSGQILPTEPDLILETLFSWADRLGVYGGAAVYNRLRPSSKPEMKAAMQTPPPIEIGLEHDLFRFKSASGWQFHVPYYFMPFLVLDTEASNGMPIQFLAISTGAAKDSSVAQRSQATFTIIYSHGAELPEFREFFAGQLGVPEDAQQTESGFKDLKTLYWYDEPGLLHTEALFWSSDTGALARVYGGIDGAYQWNRQHYVDFLRSLIGPD